MTGHYRAMKALLSGHVIGHFAFEEKRVFPPLLASRSASAPRQVVLGLVDEHRVMRAAVRTLRRKVRNVYASTAAQPLARLEQSFHDLLGAPHAHAVKEDNILLA